MSESTLHVVIRFVVSDQNIFRPLADSAVESWRATYGCRSCHLVRSCDEPNQWVLLSEWEDVGSYRRACSGYEAKMIFNQLGVFAVNEPTTYLAPDQVLAMQERIR